MGERMDLFGEIVGSTGMAVGVFRVADADGVADVERKLSNMDKPLVPVRVNVEVIREVRDGRGGEPVAPKLVIKEKGFWVTGVCPGLEGRPLKLADCWSWK